MKFRFTWDSENEHWTVKAKLKTTGQWCVVGFCHASARSFIERGERVSELLRWTYQPEPSREQGGQENGNRNIRLQ